LKKKFDEKHRYFWIDLTQILIFKKIWEKIVFESSVLAWIRIRSESIRIHNPDFLIIYQF
jgi:hypothetical protein